MRFKNNLYEQLNESAAGSATTRLQEGLHCVYFGAKQKKKNIDSGTIQDVDFLESAYNTHCSVDAPFGELYAFAVKEQSWVDSILKATNALFDSGWLKGKYTFHRGDAYMNSIYAQFNKLKTQDGVKMGNDKWNPGDIWASKGIKIPEFESLLDYNAWIAEMLHSGKLLGISLKKVKGSATVKLEGDPSVKDTPRKFIGVNRPKYIFPTGVMLQADQKAAINFRSFRVSKEADITGEILKAGTGARHGKVPAERKKEMIKKYNIPQMPKAKIAKASDRDLQNYVVELWMNIGHVFSEDDIAKAWKKRSKDISNRTGYWQSVIHALEIGAFMTSHKSAANTIMDYWYKGAKSATAESSQFIKVY